MFLRINKIFLGQAGARRQQRGSDLQNAVFTGKTGGKIDLSFCSKCQQTDRLSGLQRTIQQYIRQGAHGSIWAC